MDQDEVNAGRQSLSRASASQSESANGASPMSRSQTHISPMTSEHADAVIDIYRAGIAEGNATFETEPPGWDSFNASHLTEHRFVAMNDAPRALGWTACVPVSDRCVYAGVVEHSVYVHPDARGQGIGRQLL